MDNGLIFLVSTIHRIKDVVEKVRRRPRVTQNNSRHVKTIWGKLGKALISIPKLVNHYNHWMGGVDLSDQRIAYYMPNLRCFRNWIPLFIQTMGMIRNNSYCVYADHHGDKAMSHKDFLYHMIVALAKKAHYYGTLNPVRGGCTSTSKRIHVEEAENAVSKKRKIAE